LPSYRRTPTASVFFRKLEIAFGRDALERPLSGGDPIEAYCTLFADLWPINVQKRVELSELIAATSQRSTGPFFRALSVQGGLPGARAAGFYVRVKVVGDKWSGDGAPATARSAGVRGLP
jgi:hypothetical protein